MSNHPRLCASVVIEFALHRKYRLILVRISVAMRMFLLLNLSKRKTIHIRIGLYYKTELMIRDNGEKPFLAVKPFTLNSVSFIDFVVLVTGAVLCNESSVILFVEYYH